MKLARVAAPLAAVGLVLAGSAAQAAPVDLYEDALYECLDGTEWWIANYFHFELSEAEIYAESDCSGDPVNDDAFDSFWQIWIGDEEDYYYYGDQGDEDGAYVVDRAVAPNGDVVITGPVERIFGLDVRVEVRLYAAGDMARVLVTYTNPTGAPITVWTGTDNNYGSDDETTYAATSSGDAAFPTADDDWAVSSNGGEERDPVLLNAWQGASGSWRASDLGGSPGWFWTEGGLTVAPGATVRLAYFTKIFGWGTSDDEGEIGWADVAPAASMADGLDAAIEAAIAGATELASFSGRLVAGLEPGTVVANWGTVPGGTVPPAPPATPTPGRPTFTG